MTTDATGQVIFAVPFTAPAGLPIITATATDPQGNTSEVSSPLTGGVEVASEVIRLAPGQVSLVFSPASADSIDLRDSVAGSSGLTWELALFVSVGTLTLSSTAGLVGSGDGTGSLLYIGTLSALNAAMDGMTYVPPAGFQGNASLSVEAQSDGISLLAGQVNITTGSFVVTTTADSGPGSLRQAILDSDAATGGTNTMDFDIPGSGAQTIVPLSPLPAITNPLVIDGTTQPGYAGIPLIVIVGTGTGGADLLNVGSDVTVKGLAIGGASLPSVSSSSMFTVESVPLPQAPGGTVTYQVVMGAGADLVATAQALGATTSLLLLDAQGQIVVQSDGLSAAQPIDVIDTYIEPGTYSLEVHDSSGGGSFTLTTTLTPDSPSLDQIPLGTEPTAIVAGDFNGDGHLDLAVANEDFSGSGTISVLLGNGDGTFQPEVIYAVGSDPDAIVAGDFNGDGHLDLAVANENTSGPGTVSVLLGNGDGTFQPPGHLRGRVGPVMASWQATSAVMAGPTSPSPTPTLPDPAPYRCSWATGTAHSNPRSPTRSGRARGRSWRATSTATAASTWPWPTPSTTPSPCCWATATAPSSPRSPTQWGRIPTRSWRATSPATAGSTWPSPTISPTTSPCCWAMATARFSPPKSTRSGRTQSPWLPAISTAAESSNWPSRA